MSSHRTDKVPSRGGSTPDYEAIIDAHLGALVTDDPETSRVPGIAYGIIRHGELVHSGGLGKSCLTLGRGHVPTAETVFRIASVTKSFTAAALLSLRDDSLLSFDSPVASFVPEFDRPGWNREVTVRHLMTMSSGFPTDDPWGDRQQALNPSEFRAIIANGLTPRWRPGECFEYSNLGYALLGLVIEQVTGMEYREVVRERVLQPAGLPSTDYQVDALASRDLAEGYVRRVDKWVAEPIAGYGAFAPMGGLLSNVYDISKWVIRFVTTTDPSLLEMQTGQRFVESVIPPADADASHVGGPEVRHYGYGLFEELLPYGRVIMHSGGYPGFGSHMRWHPASGWGVVALGNSTYAPMGKFAPRVLADLVAADSESDPQYWQSGVLQEAMAVADQLAFGWSQELTGKWFADNMELDVPEAIRREQVQSMLEDVGPLRRDPDVDPKAPTPAQATWWLVGGGQGDGVRRVRVDLLLSPHPSPKIQALTWTKVDSASPAGLVGGPEQDPTGGEPRRTQINPRSVSTNF